MHAPSLTEHDVPNGPPVAGAPLGDGELARARAAVASIARVRDQLAETQRSLEAFIARAVTEADQGRSADGAGVR